MTNWNRESEGPSDDFTDDDGIDELELQRLLDGRLEPSDFETIVQIADQHPRQWKQIALAALEEQQWRRAMQATSDSVDESRRTVAPSSARATGPAPKHWLAIAGAVMLAFVAGWIGQRSVGINRPVVEIAEKPSSDSTLLANVEPTALPGMPEPVGDTDADGTSLVSLRDTWQQLLGASREPALSQRARDTLANYGYQVYEQPMLMVLEDEDGGGYVIPQSEIVLVSSPGS